MTAVPEFTAYDWYTLENGASVCCTRLDKARALAGTDLQFSPNELVQITDPMKPELSGFYKCLRAHNSWLSTHPYEGMPFDMLVERVQGN